MATSRGSWTEEVVGPLGGTTHFRLLRHNYWSNGAGAGVQDHGSNISDESSFFVSVELCTVLESEDTGSDDFFLCLFHSLVV